MKVNYEQDSPPIIDRYFLGSLLKLKEDLKSNMILISTRAAVILLMMILNRYAIVSNTQDAKDALNIYLIMILIQNVLQLGRQMYFYFGKFKVKSQVLKVAENFSHCLHIEELKEALDRQLIEELLFFEVEAQWGLSVSRSFYDFETMKKQSQTDEDYRNSLEKMGNHSIKATLETQMCCYRYLGYLFGLYSAFLLIYAVILNLNLPLTDFQESFVEFYIISELLFNTKIFVFLLILALVPLILFILIVYACCCRKSQKKAIFPNTVAMTPEMMSKCSDCAICFQTFIAEENVIVLKCSELHIFHDTCIKGWGKIKATCPICRREIE